MGKLMPFCLANNGNTVYAIAYAYLAGPTAPAASSEPDNIILVKSNPFDSISTTTSNPLQDVTWTTLSVVNRFTLNQLRPGYNYGYSCGVNAFDPTHPTNFVFTLHVDLTGLVNNSHRFSLQFWGEGTSINTTVVNSRLNEDKEIKDFSANDYWSSAYSSNAALFPMVLDSGRVNGSTEWTQMYLNRTTSAIHFLTTAGHIFPDKPQTSWMNQVKSPIAASFSNNTIFVWETEPRHAIIMIPTLSATPSTADQLALSQPASRSFWRNITLSIPDASVVQARIAVNGPWVHVLRFEEVLIGKVNFFATYEYETYSVYLTYV
ncbi:hypothetical protein BGZ93_005469 [Podila epicladia]|nr:hypothetical protein BGZ92_004941 [Podila epicladia]KAG0099865.1 hypothetical protein BGZ93_005469 [Podila epicladia]